MDASNKRRSSEGVKKKNSVERKSSERRSSNMIGYTVDEVLTSKGNQRAKRTSSSNMSRSSSLMEKRPSDLLDRRTSSQLENAIDEVKLRTKRQVPAFTETQLAESPMIKVSGISSTSPSHKPNNRGSNTNSLLFPARISVDRLCLPAYPKPVFEATLEAHLANYEPRQLSIVLETCICALYEKGIHTESILRIPGTHNEVQLLKRMFDKGAKFDILKFDIHAIASALKLYLRELPDPLIPAIYYERYLKAMLLPTHEEKITEVKNLLKELPSSNKINLAYLISFLHDVSTCELRNKMNGKSLGICIGSNLLRLPKAPNKEFGDCLSEISHFGARNTGAQFLIENTKQLFQNYAGMPKTLSTSPGSIYLNSRSVSLAPKRFSDIREFFKKKVEKFLCDGKATTSIEKENVNVNSAPPRPVLSEAQSTPTTPSPQSLDLLRQRNLSVSHFDVRQSVKRHSATSSTSSAVTDKHARRSLDSINSTRRSAPKSRSSMGPASSPRISDLEEAVFEAVKEEGACASLPADFGRSDLR